MVEKVPLFLLAIACSIVTFTVQKSGGAMQTVAQMPFTARLSNTVVSYILYLGKMFWPTKLAVLYPQAHGYGMGATSVALIILLVVTAVTVRFASRAPFAVVGWLWFLGTLVPVIGLVQVGIHSMADRYTYIPSIGICIAVVWLLAAFAKKALWLSVTAIALVGCIIATRGQLQFWRNSETLFEHTLAVTKENYLAHNNLGNALHTAGKGELAVTHYREALRINPESADAHYNLGNVLLERGDVSAAVTEFNDALRYDSRLAQAHNNLGVIANRQGNRAEAEKHFAEAVKIAPDSAEAHSNLASVLTAQGRIDEAIVHYTEAVRLKPNDANGHLLLGRLLAANSPDTAVAQFREALRLRPEWPTALADLAWLLSTHPDAKIRNGSEAVQLATRACDATGFQDMRAVDVLAVAYAEAGQFKEAIATAEKAKALALSSGKTNAAQGIQGQIELYQRGEPFRQF